MARKPPAPRKLPPHTRRTRGLTSANRPLSDQERAMIWTLTEEGRSQRFVAESLGIGRSTVTRELAKDPVGLEQIRAALREARGEKWKRAETLGIDEATSWLELLSRMRDSLTTALDTRDARKRRQATRDALEVLGVIPRVLQATKAAAGEACKQVQVLTGGVTERIGGTSPASDELADNPELLVEQCIAAGCVDQLSPVLKAYAQKRMAERRGGG